MTIRDTDEGFLHPWDFILILNCFILQYDGPEKQACSDFRLPVDNNRQVGNLKNTLFWNISSKNYKKYAEFREDHNN